jgi:DNA-binding transcriptional ArsR family regulator
MSSEHVGWAFRQNLPATRKFVLVALADRCNKDTLRCDPSIRRLAEDTGLDERTVSRALVALEEDGYIKKIPRQRENGSDRSNEFQFPGVTMTPPPRQSAPLPPGGAPPPEPELRTRKEPLAAAPRARNEIWDMLDHMFGPAATRSEETKRGKVVSSLKRAGATPDEMHRRAQNWPAWFENAALTETALESHWSKLARKPLRGARR